MVTHWQIIVRLLPALIFWLREGKTFVIGGQRSVKWLYLLGFAALGIHRFLEEVYAAYGGVPIFMACLWCGFL